LGKGLSQRQGRLIVDDTLKPRKIKSKRGEITSYGESGAKYLGGGLLSGFPPPNGTPHRVWGHVALTLNKAIHKNKDGKLDTTGKRSIPNKTFGKKKGKFSKLTIFNAVTIAKSCKGEGKQRRWEVRRCFYTLKIKGRTESRNSKEHRTP